MAIKTSQATQIWSDGFLPHFRQRAMLYGVDLSYFVVDTFASKTNYMEKSIWFLNRREYGGHRYDEMMPGTFSCKKRWVFRLNKKVPHLFVTPNNF